MKTILTQFASLPRGQKRLIVVITLVVVLPFVTLVGLQIHNATRLAMLGSDLAQREDAWKADAIALAPNVDPDSLGSIANQFAYRLLSRHAELLPERRAVVTLQIPLDDMRKKAANSGARPEELLDRAAEKIQAVGEDECRLMLGALASQCMVMSATGRALGDTAYEYQMQLAFAEINKFGRSDPAARYEFMLSRSSPGRAATNQRLSFERSAGQRRQIYVDVAETCQAIRRKAGNCSVTALSIASRLDRGTPMVRISASAAYASLAKAPELAASTH